jgi:transcriptional regulator with XRE-family HTH domain
MNADVSPTLRRRRLGREIRKYRDARNLSGEALARQLTGVNQARLSRVEGGKGRLTAVQLRTLIEVLAPGEQTAQEWQQLWEQADQLGWWADFADFLDARSEMLVGFESDAVHLRQYIEAFVPSLLTTPEYTRAVVHASQSARPSDMAGIVEFRQRRQRRLDDPNFRYTLVMAEGALHRHVGGSQVLAEQLRYLLDAEWAATVEVLVVPFEADVYAAQGMSFEIMQFADPEDPECVFIEFSPGSGFLEKPSELRYYNNMFGVAVSKALDVERSRERIEKVWSGL